MIPIKYTIGDATVPRGTDMRFIAHICNDYGGWGAGFVLALSEHDIRPEKSYRAWARQERLPAQLELDVPFELGEIKLAPFGLPPVYVVNMIAQKGNHVDYDALNTCLLRLSGIARLTGASVHMPRIGCGLGGGVWSAVEPIIMKRLCVHNVNVTVYDLPGKPFKPAVYVRP